MTDIAQQYFRIARDIANPRKDPSTTHDDIAADLARFHAAGGCVQQVPTGQSGEERMRADMSASNKKRRRAQLRQSTYAPRLKSRRTEED